MSSKRDNKHSVNVSNMISVNSSEYGLLALFLYGVCQNDIEV
ncbi:hypothetical protein P7A83_15105 [Clostridium perfringens]|nr:hypothetical protein [Clostridium perfringens]